MIKKPWTFPVLIVSLSLFSATIFAPKIVQSLEIDNEDQKSEQEGSHHKEPDSDRLFYFEKQVVRVDDFDSDGFILAIGGGGEGVIGQLKDKQVVSIDISKRELEESPSGPLKIIMDATDLKFLNDSFNTAASFFTLCYISGKDHEKVLREVFRVLASNGKFLIWDVNLQSRIDKTKDIAIFPLLVKLPNKEINTGYGVDWPTESHNMAYYANLSKKLGFEIVTQKIEDQWFFLELRKP